MASRPVEIPANLRRIPARWPGWLPVIASFFERAKAMPWWFWVLLLVFVGLLVLLFVLRNKRPED